MKETLPFGVGNDNGWRPVTVSLSKSAASCSKSCPSDTSIALEFEHELLESIGLWCVDLIKRVIKLQVIVVNNKQ